MESRYDRRTVKDLVRFDKRLSSEKPGMRRKVDTIRLILRTTEVKKPQKNVHWRNSLNGTPTRRGVLSSVVPSTEQRFVYSFLLVRKTSD